MRKITLSALAALLLAACSHYKFWDISEFHMDPKALADMEEIKLLYSSRGPDDNKDVAYFVHVIAVSQKTGDTVNILTTVDNGFSEAAGDQVFNFFSEDNDMARIMHAQLESVEYASDIENLHKIQVHSITKIARDPAYDYLARNKYPSIIGWIGTYSAGSAE